MTLTQSHSHQIDSCWKTRNIHRSYQYFHFLFGRQEVIIGNINIFIFAGKCSLEDSHGKQPQVRKVQIFMMLMIFPWNCEHSFLLKFFEDQTEKKCRCQILFLYTDSCTVLTLNCIIPHLSVACFCNFIPENLIAGHLCWNSKSWFYS